MQCFAVLHKQPHSLFLQNVNKNSKEMVQRQNSLYKIIFIYCFLLIIKRTQSIQIQIVFVLTTKYVDLLNAS